MVKLLDTSSDEGQPQREGGRSQPRILPSLNQDFHVLRDILDHQCFSAISTHDYSTFLCRFRVMHNIIVQILEASISADTHFVQKHDCAGLLGMSSFQKLSAAIRMVAYSIARSSVDDKTIKSATTAMECI